MMHNPTNQRGKSGLNGSIQSNASSGERVLSITSNENKNNENHHKKK